MLILNYVLPCFDISVHVHTYNFQWAKNPVPYKHCPFEGLKNAYIAQKTHCKYYISKIKKTHMHILKRFKVHE